MSIQINTENNYYSAIMYVDVVAVRRSTIIYGRGSGDILLDDLDCIGTEDSLLECPANVRNMDNHDCTHFEDAGVRCGGK